MKFMLRHSDQVVGIFVLIGTLFLVGAVLFVGINNRWFARDLEYRSSFHTAEGLSPGLELKLRGFAIGRVKSLTLSEADQVEVIFSVYSQYSERIVPGSVVELVVQPLGLGSSLVLYPGLEAGLPLEEGSLIPSTDFTVGQELLDNGKVDRPKRRDEVASILEALPPLVSDADLVITTLDQLLARLDKRLMGVDNLPGEGLLGTVDGTLQEVEVTVNQFGNLAAQLAGTTEPLQEILQSLNSITRQLETADALVPALLGSEGSGAQLFQDDAELYDRLLVTMAQLQEMMVFLNQSTPEISLLMEETTQALIESEKVMQGLKNNPLLRGGISGETQGTVTTFEGYRHHE